MSITPHTARIYQWHSPPTPPTIHDSELCSFPHVIMTRDTQWSPNMYDSADHSDKHLLGCPTQPHPCRTLIVHMHVRHMQESKVKKSHQEIRIVKTTKKIVSATTTRMNEEKIVSATTMNQQSRLQLLRKEEPGQRSLSVQSVREQDKGRVAETQMRREHIHELLLAPESHEDTDTDHIPNRQDKWGD